MNKQAILNKLASIRLAINYVLRQRNIVKVATSGRSYLQPQPVPTWDSATLPNGNNYLPNGDSHWIEDGQGNRTYFRSSEDLTNYVNNPELYPTRPGSLIELPGYRIGDSARDIQTNIPQQWSQEDLDDAMESLNDIEYTGPIPGWYRRGVQTNTNRAKPQPDIKPMELNTTQPRNMNIPLNVSPQYSAPRPPKPTMPRESFNIPEPTFRSLDMPENFSLAPEPPKIQMNNRYTPPSRPTPAPKLKPLSFNKK